MRKFVHRKEIRVLTFRALAVRENKSRNCGLYVAYVVSTGATLLVEAWKCEKKKKENICLQIGFLCLFFQVSIVQFPGGLGLGVAGIHISADTL